MYMLPAFIALLVDRFLPPPNSLFRTIGHPIVWIGGLIGWLESRLNDPELSATQRRRNGMVMLAIILVVSMSAATLLRDLLRNLPLNWIAEGLVASVFLAHRELKQAVLAVATALKQDIETARYQVSHIVGRDTAYLDEPAIARAAIESLAENSSDGVVAPLFWFVLLGLPGLVAYKAINTADSMVGHLNDRYRDFGWASAKLDDWVNFVPARITAFAYSLAAWMAPGANPREAWHHATHDAPNHASPNAGWPEAALAGALGFALGGPRAYHGEVLDLPTMGHGRTALGSNDIQRSVDLFDAMGGVIALAIMVLALFTN